MSGKLCLVYFDESLVEEIKAKTVFIKLTEQDTGLGGQIRLLEHIVHSNEVFSETSGISEVTLAPKGEITIPLFGKLEGGLTLKWTLCRICQMSNEEALFTLYKLMKARELDKIVGEATSNPRNVDTEDLYYVGKIVKLKGIIGPCDSATSHGKIASCNGSTLKIAFSNDEEEDKELDISLRQPNHLQGQAEMLIDRPISIIGRVERIVDRSEHAGQSVSLLAAAIFLEPRGALDAMKRKLRRQRPEQQATRESL